MSDIEDQSNPTLTNLTNLTDEPNLTKLNEFALQKLTPIRSQSSLSFVTHNNAQSQSNLTNQLINSSTHNLPQAPSIDQYYEETLTKAIKQSSQDLDLPEYSIKISSDIAPPPDILTKVDYTIIEVAINRSLYATFDYKVKGIFDNTIRGCRVKVNFGRGKNNEEIGFVICCKNTSDFPIDKLKYAELLDNTPLIHDDIFAMMYFGAQYYHYPIGQVLPLALPKLLREGDPAQYKEMPGLACTLTDEDYLKALQSLRSIPLKALLSELKQGARKRCELREQGFTAQQELSLLKKGYLKKIDFAKDLHPYQIDPNNILASPALSLNDEQQQALDTINQQDGFKVFLINGVTGSGKTEVYLQAIEHVLKQGKKALVLVPEISLTPQTFRRFYSRFKVPIATMHSTLSDRERLDAYLDMYYEKAMILIGTRSAIFSSIKNLGLIVIDEEHDSSFKQNDTFRYHARSLAIYRAKLINCKVILGSATPSVESVYNTYAGNYTLINLYKRAKSSRMPELTLVNLRDEAISEHLRAGIGSFLEDKIGETTAKHQQALLFLNKRGYSHALYCHNCCNMISCNNCDNPLTFHKSNGYLHCHICNMIMRPPKVCPHCGKDALLELGTGTEQIEDYLQQRFMDVGIERIDRDNITTRADLEEALERVLTHESEILIGTQMLAKGHDFPDVTLVGILDVDGGLYSDDYRSLEYTAQLITQVAGRAGRAGKVGQVYIQTRFPNHILLQRMIEPNFKYFDLASELLCIRKDLMLPPFTFQAFVMTNALDRDMAYTQLTDILLELSRSYPDEYNSITISPPISDRIEKRFNRYHFHAVLTAESRSKLSIVLDKIVEIYADKKRPNDLRFAIDVDPITIA